jgi:hypothetical protein
MVTAPWPGTVIGKTYPTNGAVAGTPPPSPPSQASSSQLALLLVHLLPFLSCPCAWAVVLVLLQSSDQAGGEGSGRCVKSPDSPPVAAAVSGDEVRGPTPVAPAPPAAVRPAHVLPPVSTAAVAVVPSLSPAAPAAPVSEGALVAVDVGPGIPSAVAASATSPATSSAPCAPASAPVSTSSGSGSVPVPALPRGGVPQLKLAAVGPTDVGAVTARRWDQADLARIAALDPSGGMFNGVLLNEQHVREARLLLSQTVRRARLHSVRVLRYLIAPVQVALPPLPLSSSRQAGGGASPLPLPVRRAAQLLQTVPPFPLCMKEWGNAWPPLCVCAPVPNTQRPQPPPSGISFMHTLSLTPAHSQPCVHAPPLPTCVCQECSAITPWLFLAGEEVSRDLAALRRAGIACVVNCAAGVCQCPFVPDGVEYLALALNDSPDEDILCVICRVIEVRVRLG